MASNFGDNDSLLGMQNQNTISMPDNTEELVRRIQKENMTRPENVAHSLQNHGRPPMELLSETLTRNMKSNSEGGGLTGDEKHERLRILARLKRLSAKPGFPPMNFKHDDSLSELRRMNNVATYAGRAQFTVDILKRSTIFVAKLAEALTKAYPNEYVDLDGYADHLYTTIASYDNLLHDIFDFYSESFTEVNPVVTYITAIGSNMAMYSISRKIVKAKEKVMNAFASKKRAAENLRKRRRESFAFSQKKKQNIGGDMSEPDFSDNGDGNSFKTLTTEKTVKFATESKERESKNHSPTKPVVPDVAEKKMEASEAAMLVARTSEEILKKVVAKKLSSENEKEKEKEKNKLIIDLESMAG